jgi:predicted MPP superfamily phosphohydrolase
MKKIIVHLADLHYRKGWTEEQGVVLNEFFNDLKKQIEATNDSEFYLAFTGDLVQEGADSELYDDFINEFSIKLDEIGIPKSRRLCIPGNHDVSAKIVESNYIDHEGVILQMLDEKNFNDYIAKPSPIFIDKFSNYKSFEKRFADLCTMSSKITGEGWHIDENIGVYCLNSSICSCAGFRKSDRNRLAIDTRSLHNWNLKSSATCKILIMHHPIDWLTEWAQKELKTILRKSFNLCLTGHAHEQSATHSICNETYLVECAAPPMFTRKSEQLGYSMITIDSVNDLRQSRRLVL